MHRSIKFRAWSTKKKEWLAIGFHIIGETTLFDLLNQHRLEELDEISITQFTGLKDCQGNDIYEGDIIELAAKGLRDKGEVKFEDGRFSVFWNKECKTDLYQQFCSKYMIVGNIFEGETIRLSIA